MVCTLDSPSFPVKEVEEEEEEDFISRPFLGHGHTGLTHCRSIRHWLIVLRSIWARTEINGGHVEWTWGQGEVEEEEEERQEKEQLRVINSRSSY